MPASSIPSEDLSTPGAESVDADAPMSDASVSDSPDVEITPLLVPADGLPEVVVNPLGLRRASALLAAGHGPIAVDAERASGYRYGQRAYLVQLRRAGAGTVLVDPISIDDFSSLADVLDGPEWVLHAASQDLPCLDELGLRPRTLFDTELGARLAGQPRVGLGPLVENVLGLRLEKGHSAADWSTRPLPEPWLHYAALDVEVLVELRDAIAAELDAQGKLDWALQEFAALVATPAPGPRTDPWRRTSGLHKVRDRRALARVRALWEARDAAAQRRDVSPGRVLSDAAIIEMAMANPATKGELAALPAFKGRGSRRPVDPWWRALETARDLDEADLPTATAPTDAPPPARAWPDRDPEAAARLSAARTAVAAIADEHRLPVENLLTPDAVRRLCWRPLPQADEDTVRAFLAGRGARSWQIELTAPALAGALRRVATP